MTPILPIVLCGGSGMRLWPLSRSEFPKPFVPLIDGQSLMTLTLKRSQYLAEEAWCVAGESHRFMVVDSEPNSTQRLSVLLEPAARDTCAAIAWAVALAQSLHAATTVLCFMPADHHVPDQQAFTEAVMTAANRADASNIVLLGVKPEHASTAYGYIRSQVLEGSSTGDVKAFVEKPDQLVAEQLIADGEHWWNAGVFVGQIQAFAGALKRLAPDIWQDALHAMQTSRMESWDQAVRFVRPDADRYATIRKQSFDYAVVERYEQLVMVPLRSAWTDMGSWDNLAALQVADDLGNRIKGLGHVFEGSNNCVHTSQRPVVVVGLDNVNVVETPDAVLVTRVGADQGLKNAVLKLQSLGIPQLRQHRVVHRPWGWYDSIDQSDNFQVKRIVVKPGGVLSLQRHQHRAEHWVVVQGRAQVTRGDEMFELQANMSTYISQGQVHRLRNVGDELLVLIEVQTGTYFGEDDIERLEDVYNR